MEGEKNLEGYREEVLRLVGIHAYKEGEPAARISENELALVRAAKNFGELSLAINSLLRKEPFNRELVKNLNEVKAFVDALRWK